MSDTAICVYCGETWRLADGMCHACENGAKMGKRKLTEEEISRLNVDPLALYRFKERGDDDSD